MGSEFDPAAVYVLDAGVGLAFARVDGGLNLLVKHYGSQLVYTDSVYVEWRRQARRPVRPLEEGHRDEDKRVHDELRALQAAAMKLVRNAGRLGERLMLASGADQVAIEAIVEQHRNLKPNPNPHLGEDLGECASVHAGTRIRTGHLDPATGVEVGPGQARTPVRVVAICANDQIAGKLANNYGLGHRTMAEVLREMVHAGHLSADDAYAMYLQMTLVTRVPVGRRPFGPDWFSL